MKKILAIILAIAFIPAINFAQWGPPGDNQGSADELKAPQIEWIDEFFDVGDVPKDVPVSVTFKLKNTGNAPLIISKVEPSCDCTAAEFQKTPIMPGQTAEITVTYDADKVGNFSKAAEVTTNAKPSKKTLVFTGTVVAQ